MNEEKIYSVKKDLKQQAIPEVKKKKPEIWFDDVDECLLVSSIHFLSWALTPPEFRIRPFVIFLGFWCLLWVSGRF